MLGSFDGSGLDAGVATVLSYWPDALAQLELCLFMIPLTSTGLLQVIQITTVVVQ